MRKSSFSCALWATLLCFCCLAPCWGQTPWYYPDRQGKGIVNPYLTLARVQSDWKEGWRGQTVLWHGRVREHEKDREGGSQLLLETSLGKVWVLCSERVRHLNLSRLGYYVAVKGKVERDERGTVYLKGLSVIVLKPAREVDWSLSRPVEFATHYMGMVHPRYASIYPKIARAVVSNAQEKELSFVGFLSLLQIESGFDSKAVSSSGAMGMGQLMPFVARELGVDASQSQENVEGSSRLLARLKARFANWSRPRACMIAGYNAGGGAVERFGGVPPYTETQNYVYFIGFVEQFLLKNYP